MKFIALFALLFLLNNLLQAQDVIVKINGDEIEAKVIEIGPENITYKKASFLEGPNYVVPSRSVLFIKFSNGTKEIINDLSIPQNSAVTSATPQQNNLSANTAGSNYFSNRQNIYFALATGYGNSYGGFGLQAMARFGRNVGFGIHGGIGWLPNSGALASGGLKFYPYRWIYFNAQFGYFGYYTYEELQENSYWNGESYEYESYYYQHESVLFGPSFLTGIDMLFGKHFGFQAGGGVSIGLNGYVDAAAAFDLGFIYKF